MIICQFSIVFYPNVAPTAILRLFYGVEPLWSHCRFGVASVCVLGR